LFCRVTTEAEEQGGFKPAKNYKMKYILVNAFVLFTAFANSQPHLNNSKMNNDTSVNNPLLCDVKTGICEMPGVQANRESLEVEASEGGKIKVLYFTDPICSSCWGLEPQLRKLKLEYGSSITIEYHMGGLLPDWNYSSGGISKPSDVAHHWDEVSAYYDMPIDGDVWLEDPLSSSYPPSIAFKAAQLQDPEKAVVFLRELREMVFLQKINITRWEPIEKAARMAGLDIGCLKSDVEGPAKKMFEEDLELARKYGVRGFPSVFFEQEGNSEFIYGTKPYAYYEMGVLKLKPDAVKEQYSKKPGFLFDRYTSLTAREFSELSGTPRTESEDMLNDLVLNGMLHKITTKNGALWTIAAKE